jgi:uncharacterized membrane protein YeaQ/YmgE (transglycosylase-associated protein family)
LIGLVAGFLAGQIMGRSQDLLMNLLVGCVGAILGGFLANLIGLAAYGLIGQLVIATLGAVLFIFILRKVR